MASIAHKIPTIAGEWQLLYKPEKTGCYVNDHSLILAHDGLWHLFGITRDGPEAMADRERYFTHGAGPSLLDGDGLREINIVCDNGVRAWAPAVIQHDKLYHMYYGPSPMRFAVSHELTHWMEQPVHIHDAPLEACHRDSMVLKIDDARWLMYITGVCDGYGVVSVLESHDLVNWRFLRYALQTSGAAPYNPPWGATESPFVVARDGVYYLFMTYTDCSPDNYHNTLVFVSDDPTNFGRYTGDNEDELVITKLHAHAPEIIQQPDGRWCITTCGWRNMGTPMEGAVAVAPLEWR